MRIENDRNDQRKDQKRDGERSADAPEAAVFTEGGHEMRDRHAPLRRQRVARSSAADEHRRNNRRQRAEARGQHQRAGRSLIGADADQRHEQAKSDERRDARLP